MSQNTVEAFAPLIAAGFPLVQPGEAFTILGDETLGLLQGAAQALPAPWVVFATSAEHLDEPPAEGPRQWRCLVLDMTEARTAVVDGADLLRGVREKTTNHVRTKMRPNA